MDANLLSLLDSLADLVEQKRIETKKRDHGDAGHPQSDSLVDDLIAAAKDAESPQVTTYSEYFQPCTLC